MVCSWPGGRGSNTRYSCSRESESLVVGSTTSHSPPFTEISAFAAKQFKTTTLEVLDRVREKTPGAVLPLEYLHVIVQEIGNDEANDLASLYHVCDTPGFQREQPLFENERLFLNYALAVAASYAVKRRLDFVVFSKVRSRTSPLR